MARAAKRYGLAGLSLGLAVLFAGLGVWQVQRLAWKTALVAQVEARLAAPAVSAPPPGAGPPSAADAYRVVTARGVFRHDRETLVQAVTVLGPGWWVMTPLEETRGFVVLVNRGFVPADRAGDRRWRRPQGAVAVTGLMRLSEPGGGFLRANDAAADRWRSRDVAAIAGARGLSGPAAGYFIDARAGAAPEWPRGGLTVVRFRNSHLTYALTWFVLALMAALGAARVLWDGTSLCRSQEKTSRP